MSVPPSPPPGFIGKDPLTMTECIDKLYKQGTQVFEHFEALRAALENEMLDWSSFLTGERIVANRIERSPAVQRVMTEMERRSSRICGLIRNSKTVFKRLLAFHNDFLGILDVIKAERGENILLKMELARYQALLQEQEKLMKENPSEVVNETVTSDTKKNASPEVVVVEKEVDIIEISPDPVAITESPIPSNENAICVFERKEPRLEISQKELSPIKEMSISPTYSHNEDVLQLDLDGFNIEEFENELEPSKDAVEFAKNFYIRDNEWDNVFKNEQKKEENPPTALKVLEEVLNEATADLVSNIPPVELSSDSEDTLKSEDFETVETESTDSSVSILEPLTKKSKSEISKIQPGEFIIECRASNNLHERVVTRNSLPLERVYCAVKTRMPVMIPLERIAPLNEMIDPRSREPKETPSELAVSALQNPAPGPSTYKIPKKASSEKANEDRPRISARDRLGPLNVPDRHERVPVRDRLGPAKTDKPAESTLALRPLNRDLTNCPSTSSAPPRGILKSSTDPVSASPGRRIRFDDLLEASQLAPGTFEWRREGERIRIIYRKLNGDSGSFTSDPIPHVQSPFFPPHLIHGILQPRISICARLGKAFIGHQTWRKIIIDKNVERSVVSSGALAFGLKYEDLQNPFNQHVGLVRQQRVTSTKYLQIVFLGNVGQKFVVDAGVVDRILHPGFGEFLILLGRDFIRDFAIGLDHRGKNDGNAVGRIVLRATSVDKPFWSTTYTYPDDEEL